MKLQQLPDLNQTEHVFDDERVAFVTRSICDSADDDPLNWTGDQIVSVVRDHHNFDPDAFAKNKRNTDCVKLGYYRHGSSLWFVQGEAPPGADCPWDSVHLAGLWIPGFHSLKQLQQVSKAKGKLRRAKALELAREACRIYSVWCNGEVYGYDVKVYRALYDDATLVTDRQRYVASGDVLVDESCGGFYLMSEADQEYMLSQINYLLK